MYNYNIKVEILPNYFLKEDGTFDRDEAMLLSGKIAGICYDKEGFSHLNDELVEKTLKRIDMTANNGHHSVYDHIYINFNLQNIPKMLAIVLNNEKEYTTSEKSARYTPVIKEDGSIISENEEELYNKWTQIFSDKIKKQYSYIFNDSKIKKLAQENARYMVTVFMPTQMIYTTSLRQINYIASWMNDYIKNMDINNYFDRNLSNAMAEFISELERLNVLDKRLMKNEKHRKLSLFGENLDKKEDHFGDVYSTTYNASLASLAQMQRHRTLHYQMELLGNDEFFVPPILNDDNVLVSEYISDISSVSDVFPQGKLVKIFECGEYKDFILKCKERLCSSVQLETMNQTKDTLIKYKKALEESKSYLKDDIVLYSKGARCTFPDFECNQDCKFKEGKTLVRKI